MLALVTHCSVHIQERHEQAGSTLCCACSEEHGWSRVNAEGGPLFHACCVVYEQGVVRAMQATGAFVEANISLLVHVSLDLQMQMQGEIHAKQWNHVPSIMHQAPSTAPLTYTQLLSVPVFTAVPGVLFCCSSLIELQVSGAAC